METKIEEYTLPEKTKNIFQQQERLFKKIETLADYCGWPHKQHMPHLTLLKLISKYSCESRILQALAKKELNDNARFDSYYRTKSEFATIKILDRVKSTLSATGIEAAVLTEVRTDIGRYDAVVALGDLSKALAGNTRRVIIEIKASAGLDFEQIGRYLWQPTTLILARVVMGQVAKLSPSDLQSYVTFSLEELTAKVDRLLSQNFYFVPGVDCTDCADSKCVYNRRKSRKNNNIITPLDTEFSDDLSSFFRNISYIAERVAKMVIEELNCTENRDLESPSILSVHGGH